MTDRNSIKIQKHDHHLRRWPVINNKYYRPHKFLNLFKSLILFKFTLWMQFLIILFCQKLLKNQVLNTSYFDFRIFEDIGKPQDQRASSRGPTKISPTSRSSSGFIRSSSGKNLQTIKTNYFN